MKWRLGIREKFALVAILLVLGAGYALHRHLFPATSRIVVDHELLDLGDEAELRCWELLNSVNQLRSLAAECAGNDKRLETLLSHLTRPAVAGRADAVPLWWDSILSVRIIDASGATQQLYGVEGISPPGIPSKCLAVTRDDVEGHFAPHVSPVLGADLPLGYAQVHTVGRPPAANAPMLRVPVMWGLCRESAASSRILAILMPLERGRSARHLSFMLDGSGNFLQHPALRTEPGGELPQPFAQLDFLTEVRKLTAARRWTGQESDVQVQRGLLFKEVPMSAPYFYLEGESSDELARLLLIDDERDHLAFTRWSDQQRLAWESVDVRLGGASPTTRVVRLLARSPEVLGDVRGRVESAYRERYPQSAPTPVHWHESIKLQTSDAQLVRFYLRLSSEERPDEAGGEDLPLYFVYAAFREELAASVNHEFREVQREGWLLGLVSGVVAYLVAIFFVRPLRHITRAAQQVTQGNGDAESSRLQHQIESVRQSLPVSRRDEAGDIARALESLLRQVLNGHERLRQLNADLEGHVRERTAELSTANEELRGLAAAKDAFLASVSHELRQPLNSIFGYLQFLEISNLDDEQSGDVNKVRQAATYLRRLIDDILDYQKIIMGGIELDPEPLDAAEFFASLKDSMVPQANERGNTLIFEGTEHLGVLHNDRARLQQIFINLLSNACKFTQAGQVTLRAVREVDAEGRAWLVAGVTDTGRGMKPEEKKVLFTKFKKLAAREGNKTGTGLGLVICKGLCELMGGSIECESEFGKGTTFIVRLPADLPVSGSAPAAVPTSPPRATPVDSVADHPLVLVVDDDAGVRELMQRFLEGKGYRVLTAADGEEGVAIARRESPAAITLDVVLPEQDGWEVLSALKSDPVTSRIPVVMVTFIEERARGYSLGAADYLVKPVDWEDLSLRLTRVLGSAGSTGPVLVVDDDPDTRELFRRALTKDGREVIEAGDGAEALAQLSRQRPSLILLDLMMPVMDGFEFVEEFRRHPDWQGIPILVVTAKHPTKEDRTRLIGSVQAILEKGSMPNGDLLGDILAFIHRHAAPTAKPHP